MDIYPFFQLISSSTCKKFLNLHHKYVKNSSQIPPEKCPFLVQYECSCGIVTINLTLFYSQCAGNICCVRIITAHSLQLKNANNNFYKIFLSNIRSFLKKHPEKWNLTRIIYENREKIIFNHSTSLIVINFENLYITITVLNTITFHFLPQWNNCLRNCHKKTRKRQVLHDSTSPYFV